MYLKRLLFLLLIVLIICPPVVAETFIVTSNSDTGPGTFRDAVEKATANGDLAMDTILFALPGTTEFDRTIIINGTITLPSKLVIDGTSQPGTKFGISDTKVIIYRGAPTCYGFYSQNTNNVEIYGLWFKNFTYVFNLTDFCHQSSILLNNIQRYTIGKAGKGNAFSSGNYLAVVHKNYYGFDFLNPIAIADTMLMEGNYFGLNDDASGIDANLKEGVLIGNSRNVTINGNSGNGNFDLGSRTPLNNAFIKFTNNNLGSPDQSGLYGSGGLAVSGPETIQGATYDLEISNNKITNNSQYCIILWELRGTVKITQNVLGEYHDLKNDPDASYGLAMIRCKPGNAAEITDNVIKNRNQGIFTSECGKICITNNSIYCTNKGILIDRPAQPIPVVSLRTINGSLISGKATPNTTVELFFTDECTNICENGKTYLGNVFADNNGDFTFPISQSGLYSATTRTADSVTSEFNGVKVNFLFATVKNATCGLNNGRISGIRIMNASSWYWENEAGNIISTTDTVLSNLAPGRYRLVLSESNVTCRVITPYYEVFSVPRPLLAGNPFSITQPTCGKNNGKIKFTGQRQWEVNNVWLTNTLNPIQYSSDSISNLPPGQYYFKWYLTEDTLCYSMYGPFILINQTGPQLDVTNVQITDASCGNSNGNITGITIAGAVGTQFIQWYDSLGNTVGTTLDLLSIRPGKYKLKFKDASACDTIITAFYIIKDNGSVRLDSTQLQIRPSGCQLNNGSIRGMQILGATSLEWINTLTGSIISTTADLLNAGPGTYRLIARNTIYGCSVQSKDYTIANATPLPIQILGVTVQEARCSLDNAWILIDGITNNPNYFSFHWLKDSSSTVGTGLSLQNIGPGRYQCIATDTNGCQQQIYAHTIVMMPLPTLDESRLAIKEDTCNLSVGSVSGITVTSDNPSISYAWYNAFNQKIGSSQSLQKIPAGSYYFIATDIRQCTVKSNEFTVGNIARPPQNPLYKDVTVPKGATISIEPITRLTGSYSLFANAVGGNSLQTNNNGKFTLPPILNDTAFYIELTQGDCSSARTRVSVKVVNETKIVVPNAFTPNNDGKNDTWGIRVYGIVKLNYLRVFNRWGQLIYETSDPDARWNGTLNGKLVPIGTYAWSLSGTDYLNSPIQQSGTVTIIR